MSRYDHRVHAGNAGDVWKHFLLLEAADCLLTPDSSLVYAESHVGRPEYYLKETGDWEGGIGRIWPLLPSLENFSYFDILNDLNSAGSQECLLYPGSTRLICELAKRKKASLQADVWDIDPRVASSWESFSKAASAYSARPFPPAKVVFHKGDGFAGVLSRLSGSQAGLLFIDPPYIDPEDVRQIEMLLKKAKDRGWIVLLWYMMDMKIAPTAFEAFELRFAEAGLEGGRWEGAVMALAGAESERFTHLSGHMRRQIEKLIRILKLKSE